MYFSKSENINWMLVLSLTLLMSIDGILVKWWLIFLIILTIIVYGNTARLQSDLHPYKVAAIRRILYAIPLFVVLLWYSDNKIWQVNFYAYYGTILGLVPLLFEIPFLRFNWDKEYMQLQMEMRGYIYNWKDLVINSFTLVTSAIGEELLYRGGIYLAVETTISALFISPLLFVIGHFGTKWSEHFNKVDFYKQTLFSVLSIILLIISGSIIPSIIGHVIYNSINIVFQFKKFILGKKINNEN